MDERAFIAYLKTSKLGQLLDQAYGVGKAESEAPRLFAIYQRYQEGELNLHEMAVEMGFQALGLDAERIRRWLPKLVPRDLGVKVNVVEITPRTAGFEQEAADWKSKGGEIRDIRGGDLTI